MSQNIDMRARMEVGLSSDPTRRVSSKNMERFSNKNEVAQAVIYEHADFNSGNPNGGEATIYIGYDYVGRWWNDRISSVIVVSGNWQFYEHENGGGKASNIVGPGYYYNVELDPRFNMKNDTISSCYIIL